MIIHIAAINALNPELFFCCLFIIYGPLFLWYNYRHIDMQIREYSLPSGWFPRDIEGVIREIARFLDGYDVSAQSRAAISPHAGWYYSGHVSAAAAASLKQDAETVAVIGGHLPAGSPPLFAMEDAVRTPFGALPIDIEMRSILIKELGGKEDGFRDNTVEVLLPMVHYFFPKSKVLWLRLGADISSFEAGKVISRIASDRKVNVLGSTDLTHYGLNYGFSPHGRGDEALRWVREVNDAAFIKAVEAGDPHKVLQLAKKDASSCSAGAVLAAMGFAEVEKLQGARLLKYATSADIDDREVPDSFVGYAAFAF
jgi:AmmeMemoRadiSam system protein B